LVGRDISNQLITHLFLFVTVLHKGPGSVLIGIGGTGLDNMVESFVEKFFRLFILTTAA
jgi:hypothetical protein